MTDLVEMAASALGGFPGALAGNQPPWCPWPRSLTRAAPLRPLLLVTLEYERLTVPLEVPDASEERP
jgi:hypothetical protein